MSTRRAFTIVELLAVAGILAILFGIVFPVLAYGRRQAHISVDIASLKSVGVAMALYQQDWNEPIADVSALRSAGYLTDSNIVSPLDRTLLGQANEIKSMTGERVPSFRISYLSLADFTETLVEKVMASRGGGSVVSIAETSYLVPSQGVKAGFTGDYLRLLADGSVQKRRVLWEASPQGELGTSYLWLFTDEKESFAIKSNP